MTLLESLDPLSDHSGKKLKKRPKLKGFTETKDDYYTAAKNGKILRIGLQIKTPPCNWNCPYCYASETVHSEKEYVDTETIYWWINEGKNLGATGITINGTYEPTTNEDLLKILEHCVDVGLETTLVSNGSLLTKNIISKLSDLGVSVLLKLNVPFAEKSDHMYETYDQIQAYMSGHLLKAETYRKCMDKIYWLIDEGFNDPIKQGEDLVTKMGVESVIVKKNLPYIPKLSKQLRDNNIYSHLEVVKIQGHCKSNPYIGIKKEEIKDLFYKILEDDLRDGFESWVPKPPYVAGTCYQNLIRLNIAANGEVSTCPGVDICIGNLKEQSMREILTHSDTLQIIRNLEDYIEGDCKKCQLFKERECYGGCRGTVYQELKRKGYSDRQALVGSDPSCWRVKNIFDL